MSLPALPVTLPQNLDKSPQQVGKFDFSSSLSAAALSVQLAKKMAAVAAAKGRESIEK